jgi:hypothetical protein
MANDYSPNPASDAFVEQFAFRKYVDRINDLAQKANMTDPGIPYADDDSWRDAFNDGMSPEDAWNEELTACVEACA